MMDFQSRDAWGARPPRSVTPMATSQGIFVHYTVTPTGPDVPAIIRGAQNYHMDGHGWTDIAYSWLVSQDGRIWQGRGWGVTGGHTMNWNSKSHAVCWVGNNEEQPTPEALAAIAKVCDEHRARYGGWVQSHRDVNSTSCPGDFLAQWVRDGLPHTPPDDEDDEMRTVMLHDSRDDRIWHACGNTKVHLSHPNQVEILKFLGVGLIDNANWAWIDALATLPRE